MHGGQEEPVRALSDMYAWDGKNWSPIQQLTDATVTAVPTLHSHFMAWDPVRQRLIVTGGYVDVSDTPNPATFYVFSRLPGGKKDSAAFCRELLEKTGIVRPKGKYS